MVGKWSFPTEVKSQALQSIRPGAEFATEVGFTAPSNPGDYQVTFQLFDWQLNQYFGPECNYEFSVDTPVIINYASN